MHFITIGLLFKLALSRSRLKCSVLAYLIYGSGVSGQKLKLDPHLDHHLCLNQSIHAESMSYLKNNLPVDVHGVQGHPQFTSHTGGTFRTVRNARISCSLDLLASCRKPTSEYISFKTGKNQGCIFISRTEKRFLDCEEFCEDYDTRLIILDGQEIRDEFRRIFKSMGTFWIGGRRSYSSRKYFWIHDTQSEIPRYRFLENPTDIGVVQSNGYLESASIATQFPCACFYKITQCKDGCYGPTCELKCSPNCKDGVNKCDPVTGECSHGCKGDYRGAHCNITSSCAEGWYGELCETKCHCDKIHLCGTDCQLCERGWFGKECQMRSLHVRQVTLDGQITTKLTDNNHSSCLGAPVETEHASKVIVLLQKPLAVTFMRVKISGNKEWFDAVTTIFSSDPAGDNDVCRLWTRNFIDHVTVDIYCFATTSVKSIVFISHYLGILCSLDINFGQNVAVKQQANQSAIWKDSQNFWEADLAVDGNTGPWDDLEGQKRTCMYLPRQIEDTWWSVTMSVPAKVWIILIYNMISKNDEACCEERLRDFQVEGRFDTATIWAITVTSTDVLDIYKVYVPEEKNSFVNTIVITLGKDADSLSLCEVQAYGEPECDSGWFGIDCKQKCNCGANSTCYPETGVCYSGCLPGFFGTDCSSECPDGFYGSACEKRCSPYCINGEHSCDKQTGTCPGGCYTGFSGPRCNIPSCNDGFTGPDCKEKKLCNDGGIRARCTSDTITKPDRGPCHSSDYFGPNCQYIKYGWPNHPAWLNDNRDDTCNNGNDTTFSSSFKNGLLVVSWFRIVVKRKGDFEGLKFEFSKQVRRRVENYTCLSFESAPVDDTTRDFKCTLPTSIRTVIITGKGVPGLCSIYFSYGRNLSLRQNITGSNPTTPLSTCVDGKALYTPGRVCCTATGSPSWFKITFKRPVNAYWFALINREQYNRSSQYPFRLEAQIGSRIIWSYEDEVERYYHSIKAKMTVIPDGIVGPFTSLLVSPIRSSQEFQLCQITVYGDYVCPAGWFGIDCEYRCNCMNKYDECFSITGQCPSGCNEQFTGFSCQEEKNLTCDPGFYGKGCRGNCSENCRGGVNQCDPTSGVCNTGCLDGYLQPFCKDECVPGLFGPRCMLTCSKHCIRSSRVCSPFTGECSDSCQPGLIPPMCVQGCPPRRWGQNCRNFCKRNCYSCDPVTGMCYKCAKGKTGAACETPCDGHYYSWNCERRCGKNCYQRRCQPVTGYCFYCIKGKRGPFCEEDCPEGLFGFDCNGVCSKDCAKGFKSCSPVNGSCKYGCQNLMQPPLCREKIVETSTTTSVSADTGEKQDEFVYIVFFYILLSLVIIFFCASVLPPLRRWHNTKDPQKLDQTEDLQKAEDMTNVKDVQVKEEDDHSLDLQRKLHGHVTLKLTSSTSSPVRTSTIDLYNLISSHMSHNQARQPTPDEEQQTLRQSLDSYGSDVDMLARNASKASNERYAK